MTEEDHKQAYEHVFSLTDLYPAVHVEPETKGVEERAPEDLRCESLTCCFSMASALLQQAPRLSYGVVDAVGDGSS